MQPAMTYSEYICEIFQCGNALANREIVNHLYYYYVLTKIVFRSVDVIREETCFPGIFLNLVTANEGGRIFKESIVD